LTIIPTYNLYQNSDFVTTKELKEKIRKIMLNKHG